MRGYLKILAKYVDSNEGEDGENRDGNISTNKNNETIESK